jgi:hypothetical protein
MCSIVKPAYKLTLDERGLFQLETDWGGVIIDRGGLNEWRDHGDGIPETQSERDGIHWLQVAPAVVQAKDDYLISRGLLSKRTGGYNQETTGVYGGMSWRNEIRAYDDFFTLDVWRRYLVDAEMSYDDSICFLSPPGRAWTFHCSADRYQTRKDGEPWAMIDGAAPLLRREVTERIIGITASFGWGAMLGARGGVGLILMKYSPGTGGLLRLTRPEKMAEKKFDEIEFQFDRSGPRVDGHTQTARFLIAPIREWREVAELYRRFEDGELKL